jgi:hypothetical protein
MFFFRITYLTVALNILLNLLRGRAIAQAVNRWLPTEVAWVRFQVRCGICGGLSGSGVGFLRAQRFLLSVLIPPAAPYSSIIWAGTVRPVVAEVPSGLSLALTHELENIYL